VTAGAPGFYEALHDAEASREFYERFTRRETDPLQTALWLLYRALSYLPDTSSVECDVKGFLAWMKPDEGGSVDGR
jgi:hypothetical protein